MQLRVGKTRSYSQSLHGPRKRRIASTIHLAPVYILIVERHQAIIDGKVRCPPLLGLDNQFSTNQILPEAQPDQMKQVPQPSKYRPRSQLNPGRNGFVCLHGNVIRMSNQSEHPTCLRTKIISVCMQLMPGCHAVFAQEICVIVSDIHALGNLFFEISLRADKDSKQCWPAMAIINYRRTRDSCRLG